MTFISVIDIFNRYKENMSSPRGKLRKFDDKEKYLDTYFAQKHLLETLENLKMTRQSNRNFYIELNIRQEKIKKQQ